MLTENSVDEDISTKKDSGSEPTEASGNLKNEGRILQNESFKSLSRLNSALVDLQYNASELQRNAIDTGNLLMQDLPLKIKSSLEAM